MAKKSIKEVRAALELAKSNKSAKLIIDVVATITKDKAWIRIKAKNGEIIVDGETVEAIESTERIAFKLLENGLNAKVKYVND